MLVGKHLLISAAELANCKTLTPSGLCLAASVLVACMLCKEARHVDNDISEAVGNSSSDEAVHMSLRISTR